MKFVHGAVRSISMVRSLGILMGLILLSSTVAEARPYRLQWDRNNDGLTTGYRVYYGTAPGAYQPSNGIDVGNVQEFTYTKNGERLTKKVGGTLQATYTYDAFGNLISWVPASGSRIDYVVDGLGRRVGRKVNVRKMP